MTALLNIKCNMNTTAWIEPGEVVKIHLITGEVIKYGSFFWSYEKRGFEFKLHADMNIHYNKNVFIDIVNLLDVIAMNPTKLTSEENMTLMNMQQTNKA